MKDFYPVVIMSKDQERTVGESMMDLLMIDNKGNAEDKLLLSAILNGNIVE
jgi:alanine racemase